MNYVQRLRWWCKKCQSFQVFTGAHGTKPEGLVCEECKSIIQDYMTNEVPKYLLAEQRKRYSDKKKSDMVMGVSSLYRNAFYGALGDEDTIQTSIIECDAGQKRIDEEKNRKFLVEREEKRRQEKEYADTYGKCRRNQQCPCGSGKKFKHCHLNLRFNH